MYIHNLIKHIERKKQQLGFGPDRDRLKIEKNPEKGSTRSAVSIMKMFEKVGK